MRKIQKWCAKDGAEFFEEEQCRSYERHCRAVKEAMEPMGKRPPGCSFSNGSGYLQHTKEEFIAVRRKLLEIAKEFTDHRWIQDSIDKGLTVHPSYAGRIISECTTIPLDRAWSRIMCVDKNFREWGQPYYAENPNEAKQIRLN